MGVFVPTLQPRETFLGRHFAPHHLFLTGALLIPAFLFQPNLVVRVAQVLLFAFLATVNGKRIKWMYFVIMVSSITIFNLFTPFGEILFTVGPLTVTLGALRSGLEKGFTIVGLVFVSLASIRPDLRLPGRLGGMIGRVFYYFERVIEGKKHIRPRRLIESLDEVLFDLYQPGERRSTTREALRPTSSVGYVVMGVLLSVNWILVFVTSPLPF